MSAAGILINGVPEAPRASLHVMTTDADDAEAAGPQAV